MSEDWYRHEYWDDAIEQSFRVKLGRSRKKAQYLRIQACILAKSFPDVALQLLDEYFALGDKFDAALAHAHRATALLALGQHDDALDAYEAALAHEERFPRNITRTHVEMPLLVARLGLADRYDRAMDVLAKGYSHLGFPIDFFQWHAARALIAAARRDKDDARLHAQSALKYAGLEHSGFRYHPDLGLVGDNDQDLLNAMASIVAHN